MILDAAELVEALILTWVWIRKMKLANRMTSMPTVNHKPSRFLIWKQNLILLEREMSFIMLLRGQMKI